MTKLNNEVVELTVEELDQVTGATTPVEAFLSGFAKGLSEPLPSAPAPAPPSGGGGGGGGYFPGGFVGIGLY
jgi:hypothetical protein